MTTDGTLQGGYKTCLVMPICRKKLRHRLEHLGIIFRFPEDGRRILFFPKRPDRFRGPLGTVGASYWGVKRPVCEADYCQQRSA